MFEGPSRYAGAAEGSHLAKPIAFALLVVIGLAVSLRLLVQRKRPLSLSPVVFLLAAGLVLLGIYAVKNPQRLGHLLGPAGTEHAS